MGSQGGIVDWSSFGGSGGGVGVFFLPARALFLSRTFFKLK